MRAYHYSDPNKIADELDAEFERWLAQVKAEAVREFVESAIKPEKIKELSDMLLAESVRELQAQAWDEGHQQPWKIDVDGHTFTAVNPYEGENK
jgi:hypothetical protein